MSAIKGRAVAGFLKARDPSISAVLLYGPDAGLVRERAAILARQVVDDLNDPFNAVDLVEEDIKNEPARLADEAAALSFTGGERIIRLRTSGETAARAASVLIDALDAGTVKPNALTLIEAGDLTPRSGLRKLFEKAKAAAALACYADDPGDIRALASEMASVEKLTFDPDALDLTAALLGDDRGVSRSEIEKLILYKGLALQNGDDRQITLGDVRLLLADGVGGMLDEAAAAAADGETAALSYALARSAAAGASPVSFLRSLQRLFARLSDAQQLVAAGASPGDAMKRLRPPVFFKEQRAFETRLKRWPRRPLDVALDLLVDAELAAKRTGAPQREIIERAALRLARLAARRS